MYKALGLALIIAVSFIPSLAYSADEKYCPLMYAIYGACSPELIDNYLMMTSRPANPPRTVSPISPLNADNPSLVVPKPEIKPKSDICSHNERLGYWGGQSGWWPTLPPFCPRIGKNY